MGPWHLRLEQWAGFPSVVLENEALFVEIIPSLGGKITRLVERSCRHDTLLPSHLELGAYRRASYGAPFDVSGFDECIPTIAPSRFAADGGRMRLNRQLSGMNAALSDPGSRSAGR